jgi:Xaa-Pro aminopeptidase
MAAAGLDVLMLTQQENVEYFSGFQTGHWVSKTFSPAVVLIHARKDPVLVLPDFFTGTARDSSWIQNHTYFSEPHAQPRNVARAIVTALRDLGGSSAAVGLEWGQNLVLHMNLADYHAVRDQLPEVQWTSGASVIWGCRMIKSALEIERLRAITLITERAIAAARSEFHEGMTETAIAKVIIMKGFEAGADGIAFTNIRAGLDRYASADSLPMDRPIRAGEMLILDIGLKLKGYYSDVAYCAHVGPPPAKHKEIWRRVVEAQDTTIASMRPGVGAKDVFRICRGVLADLGSTDMVGHGIGMDVHEPPILAPPDEHALEAGMVFALEPWVYDTTNLGIFCLEELIVITEDGCESLSTLPRDEFWWIAN